MELDLKRVGYRPLLEAPAESEDEMKCSGLEYLSEADLLRWANEAFRVLRPEGLLEVSTDDLRSIVSDYWKRRNEESIALSDVPLSPLDWLCSELFDGRQTALWPKKLTTLLRRFELHNKLSSGDRQFTLQCRKPKAPFCSIVLSTRNKASYLDLTLKSIFRQEPPFSFEVIVVDDGSTDNTREVCDRWPVAYLHLDNPRYRNPSVARNVGYRAAQGEVIIAQSDDIVHVSSNCIEYLATDLRRGEFLLARVLNYEYKDGKPANYIREYCSPKWPKPYFFLGSLWRDDLYAVGGCDEEFTEPCFDDNWFADCLINGRGLKPRFSVAVEAHHQSHAHYHNNPVEQAISYGPATHGKEYLSERLYKQKVNRANETGVWISSGGPWGKNRVPELGEPPPDLESAFHRVFPLLPLPSTTTEVAGKIPLVMNYFWAGDRMSWMRLMTLYSFRKLNPRWRVVVHQMTEQPGGKSWSSTETQDSQTYHGHDYSDQLEPLGVETVPWVPPRPDLAAAHACDLFQWDLLHDTGGWYADIDILWTAPMTVDGLESADAVFVLSDGFMTIGLVGSAPSNHLLKRIRRTARLNYNPKKYQSTGAEAIYRLAGVWPNWGSFDQPGQRALNLLRTQFKDITIKNLPQESIYPFNYRETDQIFSQVSELPEGCIGIHWFGGNSLSQQWNGTLTHKNYANFDNTYTRAAKELLG